MRWLDDVEADLWSLGARDWREAAEDRYEWERVVEEAKTLYGPQLRRKKNYVNYI